MENKMEKTNLFVKIGAGKYNVQTLPVRGFDWQLITAKGMGTYAVIAGANEVDDDEQLVIEEYGLGHEVERQRFDSMRTPELINYAYKDICATLEERREQND